MSVCVWIKIEGTTSWMIDLNNSNLMIWNVKMKDILYCKGLYALVEVDGAKQNDISKEEWKKLNRKSISHIKQWLDDSIFYHMLNKTFAHSVWRKMGDLYKRKTLGNKAFLIQNLVNLKFNEGGSIVKHLNKVQSIVN